MAFRDPTYPFKPGDFYRGSAPDLSIGDISSDLFVPGEDAIVSATVDGPGTVGLQYMLIDPALGEVVTSGRADDTGAGTFEVTIGGQYLKDTADITISGEGVQAEFIEHTAPQRQMKIAEIREIFNVMVGSSVDPSSARATSRVSLN